MNVGALTSAASRDMRTEGGAFNHLRHEHRGARMKMNKRSKCPAVPPFFDSKSSLRQKGIGGCDMVNTECLNDANVKCRAGE